MVCLLVHTDDEALLEENPDALRQLDGGMRPVLGVQSHLVPRAQRVKDSCHTHRAFRAAHDVQGIPPVRAFREELPLRARLDGVLAVPVFVNALKVNDPGKGLEQLLLRKDVRMRRLAADEPLEMATRMSVLAK